MFQVTSLSAANSTQSECSTRISESFSSLEAADRAAFHLVKGQ